MGNETKEKACSIMSAIKEKMPFFNKDAGEAHFGVSEHLEHCKIGYIFAQSDI